MKSIKVLLALLPFLLAGCTTFRQPMTMASRTKVHSDQAVLNTNQREIKPDLNIQQPLTSATVPASMPNQYNPAVGAAGGLIGSFIGQLIVTGINHHRIKVAEKDIKPIRNELIDYHFMRKLSHQVKSQLRQIHWLKLKKTTYKFGISKDLKSYLINNAKQNTTLFVGATYALNSDFNALFVKAVVELDKQDRQNDKGYKVLYKNRFTYLLRLPKQDHNRRTSTADWVKAHGSKLKRALNQASREIAKMIAMDINNPQKKAYESMTNAQVIRFSDEFGDRLSGRLMKKTANGYIVRISDGSLYAFNPAAQR